MKTLRRDLLMKLAKAGKLVRTSSYHYDDMTGAETRNNRIPVRFSAGYGDFIEGQCNLRQFDFTSSSGGAWLTDDEKTVHLHVHSNCNYDLQMADGSPFRTTTPTAGRGKNPENVRMQQFLGSHGIQATVKYIANGSQRGVWRITNSAMVWTSELAEKFNSLGFTDSWGQPLGTFAGNGGTFQVFVRGHNELLQAS